MIIWRVPKIRRHREEQLFTSEDIDRLRQHPWNDLLSKEWFASINIPSDADSPALCRSGDTRKSLIRHSH